MPKGEKPGQHNNSSTDSPCYFDALPTDIILATSQFLDHQSYLNFRLVNRRCRNAILAPQLITHDYDFGKGDKAKRIGRTNINQEFFSLTEYSDAQLVIGLQNCFQFLDILLQEQSNNCLDKSIPTPANNVTAMTVLNKDLLAIGLSSGKVFLYNNGSGKQHQQPSQYHHPVTSLVATPEGYLAACYEDGFAQIWNISSPNLLVLQQQNCNAIIAHRENFIIQMQNQPVRVWNCTKKQFEICCLPLQNQERTICIASLDINHIACGTTSGHIYIWNIYTDSTWHLNRFHQFSLMKKPVISLAAFPAYATLVCLYNDGVIKIWDYRICKEIETLTPKQLGAQPIFIKALNNGRLAVALDNFCIDIYNLPHLQQASVNGSIL